MNECKNCGTELSVAEDQFSDWCRDCLVKMIRQDDKFLKRHQVVETSPIILDKGEKINLDDVPTIPKFKRFVFEGKHLAVSKEKDGEPIIFRLRGLKLRSQLPRHK